VTVIAPSSLLPLAESLPPQAERTRAALRPRAAKAEARLEWNFMFYLPCVPAPTADACCGLGALRFHLAVAFAIPLRRLVDITE
jgi:hypothetical protein